MRWPSREPHQVTVLIVDDDPAVGHLIEVILSSASIQVERATSGAGALAILQAITANRT